MRPVVLKLSTSGSADKSAAGQRNASHIRYITTHGALEPDRAQREANAAHIVYQATHDALFDEEGARLIGNAAEAGEEAAIREALEHDGHQWRWVLSLHGDDADALGYKSVTDWHRLARQVVPALAAAIGIQPQHLRWVAAHHDPTPALGRDRHPHLHIAMWSSAPLNRPHRLTRDELRACRRAVVKIIRGPISTRLAAEKSALREAIRAMGAQTLGEMLAAARFLRGRPRLMPEDVRTLDTMLRDLAQQMPGHGRAAVAYLPAEVKAQVYAVTDWLLRRPQFGAQVAQYRAVATDLAALYVADPDKLAAAEARAYEDLRHRVAQFVARAAADLNRDMRLAAGFGVRSPDTTTAVRGLLRQVAQHLSEPQHPSYAYGSTQHDGRSRDGRSTDGRGRD